MIPFRDYRKHRFFENALGIIGAIVMMGGIAVVFTYFPPDSDIVAILIVIAFVVIPVGLATLLPKKLSAPIEESASEVHAPETAGADASQGRLLPPASLDLEFRTRPFDEQDVVEGMLRNIFRLTCALAIVGTIVIVAGWPMTGLLMLFATHVLGCFSVGVIPSPLVSRCAAAERDERVDSKDAPSLFFGRKPSRAKRNITSVESVLLLAFGIVVLVHLKQLGAAAWLVLSIASVLTAVLLAGLRQTTAIELGRNAFRVFTCPHSPRVYRYGEIESLTILPVRYGCVLRFRFLSGKEVDFAPHDENELQLAWDELRRRLGAPTP